MKVNYKLRKQQLEVYDNLNRFTHLLAHRRLGKTVLAVMLTVLKNLQCTDKRPQTFYYAPTFSQAKKVAWSYLKDYTEGMGAQYNESELKCTLPTGGLIYLGSADNPDSSRGLYGDYIVLDEPAQMPSRMYTEVLRPALSDRKGGMLMIGTPNGRYGLFYDKYKQALEGGEWSQFTYRASETGIIDEDELLSARRDMSEAEYQQEYECSWDAAIRGAYWAAALQKADEKGSITDLVYDETQLVHCVFDLGWNDATAIIFFQIHGDVINVINYDEVTNMSLPDMVKELRKLDYQYGPMIFPHDVEVHGLNTGKTRREILEGLGIEVVVAPKTADLIGDIDLTRTFINKCRFDNNNTAHLLEALRQYRAQWMEKNNVLQLRPLHDWSSHAADAFRYLATTDLSMLDSTSWSEPIKYANTGRH